MSVHALPGVDERGEGWAVESRGQRHGPCESRWRVWRGREEHRGHAESWRAAAQTAWAVLCGMRPR